jgi:hypothetical protein
MDNNKFRFALALLLILAVFDLPYGYYSFLRIIVTIYLSILAFYSHKNGHINTMYLLGGVAVLFNPIIPIYLSKGIWIVIDLATAVLIMLSPIMMKRDKTPVSTKEKS